MLVCATGEKWESDNLGWNETQLTEYFLSMHEALDVVHSSV